MRTYLLNRKQLVTENSEYIQAARWCAEDIPLLWDVNKSSIIWHSRINS